MAKRSSSARSRGSGSSAISALAASMRNFGLDVRAGGPRRSQASSLRSSWRRRSSRAAACAVALGAGEHVGRVAALVLVDGAVGDLPGGRADGVEEPAVVGDHEQRAAARGEMAASQSTPSTSRWLVGSSSSSSSGVSEQQRARARCGAARRPRAARSAVSRPCGEARERDAAEQAVEHVAERGVAGPLVVGPPADELRRGRCACASRSSPWPSSAACRSPARVTAPASGSSTPAMSRSSVDLPSPLRPTTPMRSPALTPSVTSSSTVRPRSPWRRR